MNVGLLVDLNVAEAEVLAVDDIDTQARRCNEICKLIQVKMKEQKEAPVAGRCRSYGDRTSSR